jgi:thiamine biosynthesis lipoprotein
VSGEAKRAFDCFGGTVTIHVGGSAGGRGPEQAIARAEAFLLEAHGRLSRFLPESELSRLNRDPRGTVPASATMLELAAAVRRAGSLSEGLVDGTLLDELERAGYRDSMAPGPRSPASPRATAPHNRAEAAADPARRWSRISVDRARGTVSRPPGVRIDSGGVGKGLLADLAGAALREHPRYAVDCCGDIRIGGSDGRARKVLVEDPLGGPPIHSLRVSDGAVATSGIDRRSWLGPDGEHAHHLLDPFTGRPAFTGVVQVTAEAPSAFLAEVYAKQALLSGPQSAPARLPFGGVVVLADGVVEVVDRTPARTSTPATAATT